MDPLGAARCGLHEQSYCSYALLVVVITGQHLEGLSKGFGRCLHEERWCWELLTKGNKELFWDQGIFSLKAEFGKDF